MLMAAMVYKVCSMTADDDWFYAVPAEVQQVFELLYDRDTISMLQIGFTMELFNIPRHS